MNNQRYKSIGKKSLFDLHFLVEKLEEIGNPLAMVSKVIDFKMFRDLLESTNLLNSNKKNNAGAKPYDIVELRSQPS
jgi:hypothetical protein